MDRNWLITWTSYGTWLAGDERGFVSNVYAAEGGPEVCHNVPGTAYDAHIPTLEGYIRNRMLADPFYLVRDQADVVIAQFQDTARIRNYELCAASVMFNHTHLIVGVPGDPDPNHLRELFKNWATRALKNTWPLPASGSFWTKKGSVRKKEGEALAEAVIYVARKQPDPLATFVGENWHAVVEEYDRRSRS